MKKFMFALFVVFWSMALVSYPVTAKAVSPVEKGVETDIALSLNNLVVEALQTAGLLSVDIVEDAGDIIADILLHHESDIQDFLLTGSFLTVDAGGALASAAVDALQTAGLLTVDAGDAAVSAIIDGLQTAGLLAVDAIEVVTFALVDLLQTAGLLSVDVGDAAFNIIADILFHHESDLQDFLLGGSLLTIDGIGAIGSAIVDGLQSFGLLSADVLGTLAAIIVSEGFDYLMNFIPNILEDWHDIFNVGGAAVYGAGSGAIFGMTSGMLGLSAMYPLQVMLPGVQLISLPIILGIGIFDAIVMGVGGGLAGLLVGMIGDEITDIVELICDFIPFIDYNSLYWTIGGTAMTTAIGGLVGGFSGAALGLIPAVGAAILPSGNALVGYPLSIMLGTISGMVLGAGAGLIALSGS